MFETRFKENEPMSRHTSFRVGGPARWFVEITDAEELKEALRWASEKNTPYFILGGGTNTLVSDKGFDGLVVKITDRSARLDGERFIVGAGALTASVARTAARAGLTGLEWAVSLPGTIGGAVRGNAGCFGGEMKDVVESALIFQVSKGHLVKLSRDELMFGYRDSIIKRNKDVIIEITFRLQTGEPVEIKTKMDEVMRQRVNSQPIASGTAGCLFKNVEFQDHTEINRILSVFPEIPSKFLETRRVPSGWIVDQLGLKGKTIGGISVSKEHANFLINDGKATADDIIQLVTFIKSRARDELGIKLQEEIEYVGF